MKIKTLFEESQGIVMGAIMFAIVMTVCGATPNTINKRWQKEAVEKGHAEWIIDSEGDTSFQWKPPVAVPVESGVTITPTGILNFNSIPEELTAPDNHILLPAPYTVRPGDLMSTEPYQDERTGKK